MPLDDQAEGLCPACWQRTEVISGPVCGRCGCPSPSETAVCDNCAEKDYRFSGLRCLAPFGPDIQDLIHGLKYNGRAVVARVLGERLGRLLAEGGFAEGLHLVHPVPLHPARRRERGYNQSLLIARSVSSSLGIPASGRLLARTRVTASQTGLDHDARSDNVRDAFRARKPEQVAGRRILLVDDVITTGATCNACSEALLRAGALDVRVAALASPYFEADPGAARGPSPS